MNLNLASIHNNKSKPIVIFIYKSDAIEIIQIFNKNRVDIAAFF